MTRGEYCPYCGEKIKKSNELLDGTVLRHEWFKSRKSPISPADGKNEAGEKVRFHKKAVNWVQAIALVAFVVDLCFIAGEWLQSDCERLTAGCIGAACWFIVLICVFCKRDIPITEYAPLKIKMAITGNGQASKEQVADMLQRMLRFSKEDMPTFMDATDGLAAAYCHFLQMGRPALEKGYNSWKDYIAKNPDKVK